jgi:hypothetical protein
MPSSATSRVLLKTTIRFTDDDWHVGRFSFLEEHLRSLAGPYVSPLYEVDARDRAADPGGADPDLAAARAGRYDQVWIFGVDTEDSLAPADVAALDEFRRAGGGLLLTRDHQDLGSCFTALPVVGATQHFQRANREADRARHRVDDTDSAHIGWPNYHSGRNGDAQRITVEEPLHPLVRRADGAAIEWLPAHPHEGVVGAPADLGEVARVVARGRSAKTGATFDLVVAIEAGPPSRGGRVVADSSFHHFCDCNWDPAAGAPSFVAEPWGDGMMRSPAAQSDARRYVENIAAWLAGSREALAAAR